MAIAKITLVGFKSLDGQTFSFNPQENLIVAKNGIGKSSIADAIAFGYCGTDRHGNAKPLHLISKGKEDCKVVIESDKGSEIVRTLTARGNGTIKAIRNGVPNTLTQTQLSGLLGPQDVFMSAAMPGYFMALTPSKRKEVLNAVLPKLDPYQIVLERTNQDVKGKYDLSKKTSLARITEDRRTVEKTIAQSEGAISTYSGLGTPVEPELNPATYEIVDKHKKLADEWNLYNQNKRSYDQKKEARNTALAKNNELKKKTEAWEKELSELKETPVTEPTSRDAEITALQNQRQMEPVKPALLASLEEERCLTCGTPVTRKMRETVKASNAKALADYEKSVLAVKKENEALNNKIDDAREAHRFEMQEANNIKKQNDQVKRRKIELQSNLANTQFAPVVELPAEPGMPQGNIDEQNYKSAQQAIKSYENAKAVYDNAVEETKKSADKIQHLQKDIENLKSSLIELQNLEEVVKNLSNIRLEANKQAIEIDGLHVVFEGGDIAVAWNDIPYTALSTGQRMRVDFKLSQKINSLMERPINLFFVDDSDLMDERIPYVEGTQVFYTIVDKTKEVIEVLS